MARELLSVTDGAVTLHIARLALGEIGIRTVWGGPGLTHGYGVILTDNQVRQVIETLTANLDPTTEETPNAD